MPDQYVLRALQRRELAVRDRPPLFAEVDLISSHAPWTRIPRLIPWNDVGDGSIFDRIPAEESSEAALFGDAERARTAYAHSIEYSLNTLFSFVRRYGDDNLVLVVLGDHQPATVVSGPGRGPRRADLGHRPRPEGHGPDRRMGLAGRHAAGPAGAGLADGRLPRPLPHRLRPGAGAAVRQDDRTPFDRALRRARGSAYAPGEYVGQESFMTAAEIRALGSGPGSAPGSTCWTCAAASAVPGGCSRAISAAPIWASTPARAPWPSRVSARASLRGRFATAQVPPVPAGTFDVVLLLETMLAFEEKHALVDGIAAALRPGGRFAFTLEEGRPLTAAERAAMPDPDTVWLTPLDELAACLERAGLVVTWQEDHSRAHRATAQALARAFTADAAAIAAQVGRRALDELLAAHRLWIEWLDEGRVRKLAVVAERATPVNGRAPRR